MITIQLLFRWAWMNPYVIFPFGLISVPCLLFGIFNLMKWQSIKKRKLLITAIIFFIIGGFSLLITCLFGLSSTPMDFPRLFGDPINYYIPVNIEH